MVRFKAILDYSWDHFNFFRIHLLVFTILPFIFSAFFHAGNGQFTGNARDNAVGRQKVEYIDSLFLCFSAMTWVISYPPFPNWSKCNWYGNCQVSFFLTFLKKARSRLNKAEAQHISNTPIPTSPLIHPIPMWRCLGNIARNGPSPKTIFQNTLLSTPGEWSV